jgi:hypothetical protein
MVGINQVLKICWEIVNKFRNINNNDNSQTVTITDNKIVLQALALINECNKYKMDLTTNGVVITDTIKVVQTSKEKLTMSAKEEDDKESKEPDYDEDKDQIEETGEKRNNKASFLIDFIPIVSTAFMRLRPVDLFPNHFYMLFDILFCH